MFSCLFERISSSFFGSTGLSSSSMQVRSSLTCMNFIGIDFISDPDRLNSTLLASLMLQRSSKTWSWLIRLI